MAPPLFIVAVVGDRGAGKSSFTQRFSWLTDAGTKTYQWRKFASVAATVMARRDLVPGPAYLARLEALHAAAAGD